VFEPYVLGKKAVDIFNQGISGTDVLKNMFVDLFILYLRHTGMETALAEIQSPLTVSAWINSVSPGGSLVPHYHPLAWLSAVYYPYPNSRSIESESRSVSGSIKFGLYPEGMGGGQGLATFQIDPQYGYVIVFPSYIGHKVEENRSQAIRTSIGADLMIEYR
jgi:hypothetical protein